jgi:hypothetical protein
VGDGVQSDVARFGHVQPACPGARVPTAHQDFGSRANLGPTLPFGYKCFIEAQEDTFAEHLNSWVYRHPSLIGAQVGCNEVCISIMAPKAL